MKKKGKMRKKFFVYFAVCTVIPVIIFTILASAYIVRNEVENQKNDATDRMQNAVRELDTLILEASQIGNTVSEDVFLQECLKKEYTDQEEYYQTNLEADRALLYVSKYFNEKLHVYMLGENGGHYKSGYLSFRKGDFRNQDWYQQLKGSGQEIWFDIHEDSFVANSVNSSYLSMGIPIHESKTKEFLGVVLVEVQVDQIYQELLNRQEEQIYLIHPNTSISIEDGRVELYKDNTVIALSKKIITYAAEAAKPSYIAKTLSEIPYWRNNFQKQDTISGGSYYISYAQLEVNNWILVSILENSKLYQGIYNILLITVLFLTAMLVLIFFISNWLAESVSNPIEILKEKVSEVQNGNFDVSIEGVSDDEIGELSEQFNQMVVDIKSLMNRIYEEQTKLRQYELMLLQAQINPHFLYNTLDSLCWLIRMNQSEDALKMTTALTHFFVTGLNKGRDVISLQKEMENIKSYLTIQKLRYKSKLDYYIYCEKDTEEFQVPKLILQPFVENALYHGIKGKEHGGIIEVRGYRDQGEIRLTIVDDGLGMKKEALDSLCHDIKNTETAKTDSYGIKNVNERLQLFYKDNYSMEIQSELGIGTFVTISIKEK